MYPRLWNGTHGFTTLVLDVRKSSGQLFLSLYASLDVLLFHSSYFLRSARRLNNCLAILDLCQINVKSIVEIAKTCRRRLGRATERHERPRENPMRNIRLILVPTIELARLEYAPKSDEKDGWSFALNGVAYVDDALRPKRLYDRKRSTVFFLIDDRETY